MSLVKRLKSVRLEIVRQLFAFGMVGVTNIIVDLTVYWCLTRLFGWHYLAAAVGSFMISVTWSFLLNRRWTFRHRGSGIRGQYVRFFAVNSISAFFNLLLLDILIRQFGVYDLLAKVTVSLAIGIFNFSLNKWWTFRVRPHQTKG